MATSKNTSKASRLKAARYNRWKKAHPERAAFHAQRGNAKRRGIAWEFTFDEWWAWWQTDGRWERRGSRTGKLVMARFGDVGPYSPDNVRPLTPAENTRDRRPEVVAAGVVKWQSSAGAVSMLGRRGDRHPRSHAVITPAGRFGSTELAAEFYGLTKAMIWHRICSAAIARLALS